MAQAKKAAGTGKPVAPKKTMPATEKNVVAGESGGGAARVVLGLVLAYVAAVLLADTLAAMGLRKPLDFSMFRWRPGTLYALASDAGVPNSLIAWMNSRLLQQFDLFKCVFWFALPLLFSLRKMDWGALGVKRWTRTDLYLMGGLAVAGFAAILLIPVVPALRHTYHGMGSLAASQKALYFFLQITWIASWLPGWEFIHRYFLLRRAQAVWPRFGWLLVPFSEGVYHLQKPGLEALGMVALSVVLTQWAMRRRNVLLPFLVHLIIEIELVAFLLFL